MAALGERVIVATTAPAEPDEPPDCPFTVLRLPMPRGRVGRWMGYDARLWLGNWLAAKRLQREIRQKKPWAIYERLSIYGTTGTRLTKRHDLPRALEINAFISQESSTRLHFPKYAQEVERGVIKKAPWIAAISAVMQQQLISRLRIDPERILISPMGIDPARFHPNLAKPDFRELLKITEPIPASARLIGYVGSFNHYHRPAWLLDLAEGLEKRGIEAHIVAIGGASQKVKRHQEMARERGLDQKLHYLGALEHDVLPRWLASFDLMVVPGAAPQSSPTKIVEASAIGAPQIVPDYAPIRNLVNALGDWAFFEPESQSDFLEKVISALNRLPEIRQEAQDYAKIVVGDYSWKRRAEEIIEALQEQT